VFLKFHCQALALSVARLECREREALFLSDYRPFASPPSMRVLCYCRASSWTATKCNYKALRKRFLYVRELP